MSSDFVPVSLRCSLLLLESCKGEECIPQTWDMFHEKWGFMVIFWNFAGVPFVSLSDHFWSRSYSDTTVTQTYVYSVVYMASHEPEKYRFSTPVYVALFGTLLTAYYVCVARKSILLLLVDLMLYLLAGIPLCLKKVASRCRHKVTTTTVGRSPNCHGAQSRTRPTSKQRMGKYFTIL